MADHRVSVTDSMVASAASCGIVFIVVLWNDLAGVAAIELVENVGNRSAVAVMSAKRAVRGFPLALSADRRNCGPIIRAVESAAT